MRERGSASSSSMPGHPSKRQVRSGHLLNSSKLFAIKDQCKEVHFLQTRFASDVPECVLGQPHDYHYTPGDVFVSL